MAGVNGIEIKVGQVWRCRDGELRTVVGNDGHPFYPWDLDDGGSVNISGCESGKMDRSECDLIELVKDENGFTIWRGGEQPVPDDTLVECRLRSGTVITDQAKVLDWSYDEESDEGDIVAYKVVAEITQADSATLAEETLSALGWTFDGQAWVEHVRLREAPLAQIEMFEPPVSAPALLSAAAKHMNDRAATYDKPEGERSMAQTVAVFEAYHGIKLTEAQGWHFMQVLKDVRLFTRETYHGDSAEDCIAYAALKAEAKAQEGGA